ncbi:MAG: hypothetical protein IIY70_05130 [Oscillospiraceae bacterium]|nr:hypothetical protein [Oscillospiraceae bacterium]
MIQLIAGPRGAGKTKQMLAALNVAVEKESGSVVCVELDDSLRFDVNHQVRLIEYHAYGLKTVEELKAFISGLHAGNFDISHIFIKSVHRLINSEDLNVLGEFFDWCNAFGATHGLNFTLTARLDSEEIPASIRRYMCE